MTQPLPKITTTIFYYNTNSCQIPVYLTLFLLMLWVGANHHYLPFSFNDFTIFAHGLN